MDEYPPRSPFFAHRFVRLLHKAAVASDIGRDAFALLVVVAHTEDAIRYRGPAKFWNSQLTETLGFKKWDQFNNARKRAIEAGWLVYKCHGKRKSGEYFVLIPDSYQQVDDLPIEESSPDLGYDAGYKEGYDCGYKEGMKAGTNGVRSGVRTGDEQGEPSIPKPKPKPKERLSIPPTLEQVTSYCAQRGNAVDPETFIDFNESKGWMVGKNKMKDWQAAIRTWEKRDTAAKPNDPYAILDDLAAAEAAFMGGNNPALRNPQ